MGLGGGVVSSVVGHVARGWSVGKGRMQTCGENAGAKNMREHCKF